jgi:hypothetical protein
MVENSQKDKVHTFQPSRQPQRSQPSQPPRKRVANLPDLIEIVNTKEGLRFLMSDGTLQELILSDGIIYIPAKPTLYAIPDEAVKNFLEKNDDTLFDDVSEYIFDHLDCPDRRHFGILTAFTFHSYLIEKADASPIMRFYGSKGSGKSRGGGILTLLVRRGISTANLTGPGLFRVNEFYAPTFIIDEIQIFGKKGDKDLRDMLNVRYRKGNKMIRINKDRDGLESIETFSAFGPTVLCGTESLPDTVESRSITFFMEPNIRDVKRHIDEERARVLRNRLVAFRFRHFKTALEEPERIVKDGRLDEVLLPLHQIVKLVRPEFEPEFIAFAKELETDRKEKDFESFDAEICRALIKCRSKVTSGKIAVDDITYEVSAMRSYPMSPRAVGSALTRLGLKTCRIAGSGKYARFWDESKIRRLAERFNVEYPEES